MGDKTKLNHEALLQLEQPLISVPLEHLRKALRSSQRLVERELSLLATQASELASKAAAVTPGAGTVPLSEHAGHANSGAESSPTQSSILSPEEAATQLSIMIERMQKLKKKLVETAPDSTLPLHRTRARLAHLDDLAHVPATDSPEYSRWCKVRLDRVLAEYLLRKGWGTSAATLSKVGGIEDLTDIELFSQVRRIEQALESHSSAECLAWCTDNKSGLKKIKSTLEFQLRLQDYIELIRSRRTSEALAYARKHLAPQAETHMADLQRAMAMLAFGPDTKCEPYKSLFAPTRWQTLASQFRSDNFSLNSLTALPLLESTLQAGLSALKTPMCSQRDNRSVNCPTCDPTTFGDLAERLPRSHRVNSKLVCRMSGEVIDEHNLPMVLPNGYVYSERALRDAAAKHDGQITCPRTGAIFQISQAKKAYIT